MRWDVFRRFGAEKRKISIFFFLKDVSMVSRTERRIQKIWKTILRDYCNYLGEKYLG